MQEILEINVEEYLEYLSTALESLQESLSKLDEVVKAMQKRKPCITKNKAIGQ